VRTDRHIYREEEADANQTASVAGSTFNPISHLLGDRWIILTFCLSIMPAKEHQQTHFGQSLAPLPG